MERELPEEGGIMTDFAIGTSTRLNVLALAAAILFAISLPFVVPDPGSRDVSELHFIGP
jgi:hypothetical protein